MTTNPLQQPTAKSFETDPYAMAFPELRDFWVAAAAGRFLVRACNQCGKVHWYPRIFCPFCSSEDTAWRASAGRGRLYAFSEVVRTASPYVLAFVRLDEGPIMMTNIIDCDPDTLRIDQPVRFVMQACAEGRTVPMFTPES